MNKKELISVVASRNEKMKQLKLAGVPEVGIFWVLDNGKLFAYGVPVSEGMEYGDAINAPVDHFQFWMKFRKHLAIEYKNMEYDEVHVVG